MVQETITFECTDCRRRNYQGMKNKKNKSARLEFKKYCPHCRKHTIHKEMK
ncbi:50S ribosomal protein L33 [Atribacter laminatus]|jgi:large subunit ribosomal protein L33|uniref:Large ribosomal subunit protein bL33 n=1 Tax=Atribacter laminatus TaxID=2847778 RepID=A0A7T1AJL4_ATRLM|nr:50S ribosomal protein L33 [Atribacter laminatus]NLJ39255.1 50S ribosomal protein L33 [Candidatus Atribacteria bacterium]QPM67128.1 50S ribosomal protein L33 [Atribacter laminatus]